MPQVGGCDFGLNISAKLSRADSWLPKRSLLSGITGIDRESYAHTYYMALYSYLRDYNFITHVA